MIIVASGDSFVYGTDLQDVDQKELSNGFSRSTYPALLAKKYGYEYISCAYPGMGNDAISRRLINLCEQLRNDGKEFAVFGSWTFLHRFEFALTVPTLHHESPWFTISQWAVEKNPWGIFNGSFADETTIKKHAKELTYNKEMGIWDLSDDFLRMVGQGPWALYNTLKSITHAQLYFEYRKIPYMFVSCADQEVGVHDVGPVYNTNRNIKSLYDLIDWDHWDWLPNQLDPTGKSGFGFRHWASHNRFPRGPTLHPTEEAHQAAADLYENKFKELIVDRNKK